MAPKEKFSKNKFIFVFSAHKAFPTIYNMTILTKWQIFGAGAGNGSGNGSKRKIFKK